MLIDINFQTLKKMKNCEINIKKMYKIVKS